MSAGMNVILPLNFQASGAITKGRFVKMTAAGIVEECDTAGEISLGVALETVASGERVDFVCIGVAEVEAGAAIAVGVDVATANDGQAVAAATGNTILGITLDAAGAAGDLVRVLLHAGGQHD